MEKLKQRMTDYWSQRVENFSALRMKEFNGEKHVLWMRELEKHIPKGESWNILDVGTGTGFFAFLLASAGHHVTGIDLTEEMIAEAKRVSKLLDIPADFFVMDGEKPAFPANGFDMIVTRNLTWGLPHLREAYCAWHKLLKPNGILVNFDADYCREKKMTVLPANHAHRGISSDLIREYECMKDDLRPCQKPRPQWDTELLDAAGFHDICVDTGVWKRIYSDVDEFYNPTPIFAITAHA